jgi:hypothetical protein
MKKYYKRYKNIEIFNKQKYIKIFKKKQHFPPGPAPDGAPEALQPDLPGSNLHIF